MEIKKEPKEKNLSTARFKPNTRSSLLAYLVCKHKKDSHKNIIKGGKTWVGKWIEFIDKSALCYATILELIVGNSASREDHAKHIKTEIQSVFMYRNVKKSEDKNND